jgi:hypothetical protein
VQTTELVSDHHITAVSLYDKKRLLNYLYLLTPEGIAEKSILLKRIFNTPVGRLKLLKAEIAVLKRMAEWSEWEDRQ